VCGKVGFTKNRHELVKRHRLKVRAVEFDPINKADVLDTVKGTLDDFISRDVLVIGVLPASTLPVNACLGSGITRAHIGRFRIQFLFDDGTVAELNLEKTAGML